MTEKSNKISAQRTAFIHLESISPRNRDDWSVRVSQVGVSPDNWSWRLDHISGNATIRPLFSNPFLVCFDINVDDQTSITGTGTTAMDARISAKKQLQKMFDMANWHFKVTDI